MLSTGTTASIGIDTEILLVNLHIHILLNIRHDIQRHKGSLPLSLRVKRGNTNQSVYSFFRFQIAVSIETVDLKRDGLDSRLVAVQIIQHFNGKALALRPPGIHTVQHAAPVTALGSARSGIELQYGIVLVIFAGQQRRNSQLIELRLEILQFTADLIHHRAVVFLISHFNQRQDILILRKETAAFRNSVLHVLQFLHLGVGLVGIIPETWRLHLHLQLLDPL